MTLRPMCGSCPDCLETTNRICSPPPIASVMVEGATRPTAKQLRKHGEKFGWEQVAETGSELGIDVKLPKDAVLSLKKEKPVRPKRPPIKDRIREYLADGKGAEYIAEIEKTSASRARRLIKEVQEEEGAK